MRSTLLLLCSLVAAGGAAAQPLVVSGTVTGSDGSALIGAHVLEQGTLNGATTNREGQYTLRYGAADAVIVFDYVGYHQQAVPVEGRTTLDVVLQEGVDLSEMVVVGSRSYNRSVTETMVAVDVLDVDQLTNAVGEVELNQLLQYAAPSFNSNRQSGADGSDHAVDPASIRGLGPDQTLVLINGKRRHPSALINIFGSRGRGNTGTDLNAIPAAAIERIEILRDGASAQYGSDAIAGVINIVLKNSVDQLTASVSGAAHQAGFRDDRTFDGEQVQVSANYGVPLGPEGFLNLTVDHLQRGRTNRPADPDELAIYRRQFGDAALQDFSAFANASVPVRDGANVYAFGGFNFRDADAYAWTREADSDRNVPAIYPDGFDPRILSAITDRSLSAGLRTQIAGWDWDFSNTFGANRFHYFVDGTLNASLLERSPTRFDAGGFDLLQNTTGIGASRFFPGVMNGANVAVGAEYRLENYTIFAGEEASWRNYGIADSLVGGVIVPVDTLGRPGGAQGFPGFRPDNELDETRTNLAGYVDTEFNVSPQFTVGAAVRGEDYSDFGSLLTAKLSARYAVMPGLAIRGSASTGFRAPSLAQIYFNTTFTDFVGGVAVDKIIARNNSPLTRALGIPALQEERARNASLGFVASYGPVTATVDGYYVAIDDRIVLTGAFGADDPDIGDELTALGVGAAQFFTNALDTETYGLDVILSYGAQFGPNNVRASFAGNFNHMELGEIRTSEQLEGREDTYFGRREQHFLLASAPGSKMNLTFDFDRGPLSTNLRFVRFGEVTLIDWLDTEDVYEAKVTTDLSVGYQFMPSLRLTVGGANIFDVYPSMQDTETETGGMWDAVQMGFAGRYLFARLGLGL